MTLLLHNYFKSIKPQTFAKYVQDKSKFESILIDLNLDTNLTLVDLAEHMLAECKKQFNIENKDEGMIILRHVKVLLPLVPKTLHAFFYLALADSFLLSNDYEGAEKAVHKADTLAQKLNDPRIQIKVYNMLFIINRTIGKDKAVGFLLKSKELSELHNLHENIVFCDVNLGLLHLFKKETSKAVEYCSSSIELITSKPYPTEKIMMPSDYFLQVFSENPGLAVVSKNKETILKGVSVVIRSIKFLKSDYESTRRLTILTSILKLSESLLEPSMKQIDEYVDNLKQNKKAKHYAAIAHGVAEYKEYKLALVYFDKAVTFSSYAEDGEQKNIKKGYAYTLAQLLGVSMIYDLESSSQTTQKLKKLTLNLKKDCLIGKENQRVAFNNAVSDSDAAFALTREIIQERLLVSIKDRYKVQNNISGFFYRDSKEDILDNLEIFTINAMNHNDEVQSLLLVGSTIDEKDLRKNRKVFSGYQILGHILPKEIRENKHKEDFDIKFINDLLRAPQRFKKIEILIPSDEIMKSYKPLFSS
ncbi:MAG: hypothetical protein KGD64_07495 [Candidatus Heimdallarchaeota archaeon]|nr:hypothetical protein [Candidatus Heimdallarchaeota archaeon]